MIRKKDVIKMLDEWLERLDESDVSEAIECVLLMVKNKIENMPEAVASNARLIDAEKLKETIEKGKIIIDSDVLECDSIHKTLVYLLEKVETFVMEAIDAQLAVETVVWCKDCEKWHPETAWCKEHSRSVQKGIIV